MKSEKKQVSAKTKTTLFIIGIIVLCLAIGAGAVLVMIVRDKRESAYRKNKENITTAYIPDKETQPSGSETPVTEPETAQEEQPTGGGGVELTPEQQEELDHYLNELYGITEETEGEGEVMDD